MAYTDYDTPGEFFGPGYSLSSNEVRLKTATDTTGTVVGTTFGGNASDDTLVFAAAHGLKIGDRIKVTQVTTIPGGISSGSTYYVKTVPTSTTVTLAATRNGNTIDITSNGTSDNTAAALGPLDEVTDTEANASTGDARKVIYGLMEAIYLKYLGIPSADRSARMTISTSSTVDSLTGRITKTYNVRFVLEPTGVEVVDE